MTIFNTYYINGNSCSSSSSSYTQKNFFNGYSDEITSPYVSPFKSEVEHKIAHPHRPASDCMSMHGSIFNCGKGHEGRGHHPGNNHHQGGGHYADLYPKHHPIPLVPVDRKPHGCA